MSKSVVSRKSDRSERVSAILLHAREAGLMNDKNGRIASRVSARLIDQAKKRTGLQSDTELVEFALASIALEDSFADTFRELRGTVDPDVDLGY